MAEEGLDDLRQKRLQKKMQEMQKRQEQESQIKMVLRTVMDGPAYERLMNVRALNPDLFMKAAGAIAQAASSGKIRQKLSEEQLKSVLLQLSQKREGSIEIIKK